MPTIDSLLDSKPYHLIVYGSLLGSNLWNTFGAGPLAYKALPRPSFSTLQQAIFPPFFTFQTVLPLVLAFTWPGETIISAGGAAVRHNAGVSGLLEGENRWIALAPIAAMFASSLLNLVALGPATTKVMKERKHQGWSGRREAILTRILTCLARNERRQEILRPRTKVPRDAKAQLVIHEATRRFVDL